MQIIKPKSFIDCYEILPIHIQKKVEKALELLLFNPQHPSLQLKKLKGYEDVWYGRVDKHHRFTFQKQGDLLIMRRVGPHNDIIKKP